MKYFAINENGYFYIVSVDRLNIFETSMSRIKMGVVFLQAFCHLDDEICNKKP